jgi:hypothetical protein
MKTLIVAVMAATALSMPAAILAGEGPGPNAIFMGPGMAQDLGLSQPQQQAMMQVWTSAHARMTQLHKDGRNQILAVLTPAQRSLLAQVVGNLAIAPNPDPDSAAQQIQAALTPAQSQRILSLHSALEQQMHQTMTAAMNQANSVLTQQQRQKMQQAMSAHMGMKHPGMGPEFKIGAGPGGMRSEESENPQTEAGHVLLHIAMHGGEGFGMGLHLEHERQ